MIYYSKVSYTLLIIIFLVFFGPLVSLFYGNGFDGEIINNL